MSLLFRIVYAAHAKGTHHKLALDALNHLADPKAVGWQRLFLKHADSYMRASKAPDDQFKDFKNHVLHVRDGYWGGALDKSVEWYGALCTALRNEEWEKVVWNAGVLSHYVTDPIQPFHTAQSEAENSIHRAAEWSISRSYDDLKRLGLERHGDMEVTAGNGEHWLRELVCDGAEKANTHYEALIAHYNLRTGVSDPPSGLDDFSRKILAELLIYAANTFAAVLDRAFEETKAMPPTVDLALDTILAAVKIPAKVLAKRLADAEDRRIVQAMFDELTQTGRVETTLPEDDRIVRDLYAKEIEAPRLAQRAEQRAAVIAPISPTITPPSLVAPPQPPRELAPASSNTKPLKHYLALNDDIERAPTIGPRTAKRLEPLGIKTVADFLSASRVLTAGAFNSKNVTAETITLWQDQCRLMLEIPGLRGTHAELLAQSGYRTAQAIATADEAKLCSDVLAFAATPPGQRILREGAPPDIEKIKGWLAAAVTARAA